MEKFTSAMLKIMGASKEDIEGVEELNKIRDSLQDREEFMKSLSMAAKAIAKDKDDYNKKMVYGIYLISVLINEKQICLENQPS